MCWCCCHLQAILDLMGQLPVTLLHQQQQQEPSLLTNTPEDALLPLSCETTPDGVPNRNDYECNNHTRQIGNKRRHRQQQQHHTQQSTPRFGRTKQHQHQHHTQQLTTRRKLSKRAAYQRQQHPKQQSTPSFGRTTTTPNATQTQQSKADNKR